MLVYIIDDDQAIRDSLSLLLESSGYKTSCHESGERFLEALAEVGQSTIACVLLDIRMAGMSGLELQDKLLQKGYRLPLAIMTGHGEITDAVQAFKKGAFDFIQKPFKEETLCALVNKMLKKADLDQQQVEEAKEAQAKIESLTNREVQVLEGIVKGQTNKQIAETLGIAPTTIEVHRANLMAKLKVRRAPNLLKLALNYKSSLKAN